MEELFVSMHAIQHGLFEMADIVTSCNQQFLISDHLCVPLLLWYISWEHFSLWKIKIDIVPLFQNHHSCNLFNKPERLQLMIIFIFLNPKPHWSWVEILSNKGKYTQIKYGELIIGLCRCFREVMLVTWDYSWQEQLKSSWNCAVIMYNWNVMATYFEKNKLIQL